MLFLKHVLPNAHYESAPGVAAGSTLGFTAVAGCMGYQTQATLGTAFGLLSNFDGGSLNGWSISYETAGNEVEFTAAVGRTGGVPLEISANLYACANQFFLAALRVGNGEDAQVELLINGIVVADDVLGAGELFAPAANAPLIVGPAGAGLGVTNQMAYLGVGFMNIPLEDQFLLAASSQAYTSGRMTPAATNFATVEGTDVNYDLAWDTQSLLESGLHTFDLGGATQRATVGEVWAPAPGGGSQALNLLDGEQGPPILQNVTPGMYQPIPVPAAP